MENIAKSYLRHIDPDGLLTLWRKLNRAAKIDLMDYNLNIYGVMMGRVLVACEYSGTVREEFRKLGHDAWSCDLLDTDIPGQHIKGDVLDILSDRWDLMIAHPDCTYLTVSAEWAYKNGPYHQKVKEGTLVGAERREAREKALRFVQQLMSAPIDKIAIENPVGVISTRIRPADQYIQPYNFGNNASKKTGLWLKNLPKLVPTNFIQGRIVGYKNNKPIYRWDNQTDSGQNNLGPKKDRWKDRSKTYSGWAEAFAKQWGKLI